MYSIWAWLLWGRALVQSLSSTSTDPEDASKCETIATSLGDQGVVCNIASFEHPFRLNRSLVLLVLCINHIGFGVKYLLWIRWIKCEDVQTGAQSWWWSTAPPDLGRQSCWLFCTNNDSSYDTRSKRCTMCAKLCEWYESTCEDRYIACQ